MDEKSRFARNRYTRVVNEEKLRRAGVKLVGVNEPEYDPKSIHGVWMDGISITKNEAYSVEIAYHVMKGMTQNADQQDPETGYCYKNGGMAPDGYKSPIEEDWPKVANVLRRAGKKPTPRIDAG